MAGLGCGHGAVLIDGVSALSLHDRNHAKARVIPDHGTLAGFHTVSITGQCIGSVCIQRQRQIQRQTAVHIHQALQFAQLELFILKDIQIGFRTGNGGLIRPGNRTAVSRLYRRFARCGSIGFKHASKNQRGDQNSKHHRCARTPEGRLS